MSSNAWLFEKDPWIMVRCQNREKTRESVEKYKWTTEITGGSRNGVNEEALGISMNVEVDRRDQT